MKFRYARHTTDLKRIEDFYTEVVGLENLGGFVNHDGYDGIFLGHKDHDWHLEFTTSPDAPSHSFDEDDALVFYVESTIQLDHLQKILDRKSIAPEAPKNPYWKTNGIMINDPDGFKIIFSYEERAFESLDEMTRLVKTHGIQTWNTLLLKIRDLPYGRNANRHDLKLVLQEQQGTCSSKHAFLKKIADENGMENVKLIIGLYKMNHSNTPKIGDELTKNGLEYVPEAHCYLKIDNRRYDLTSPQHDIEKLLPDVLQELEIEPEEVNEFKVEYHQNYLKKWLAENKISISFEELWNIRENCIQRLGN